jgi:hypothetical protein
MLRAISCAAVAALVLLPPRGADAQLRVIPQIGVYAPFADLPSPSEAADAGKKESTLAYGVAAELGTPDKVSFRVNLMHATDSDVPVPSLGCSSDCQRSTVTTASATLVLRPLPRIILVQPFLLAGGGVKRYDYTREDFQDEGLQSLFDDQNRLTAHLGVGAEVGLGIVRLTAEISDLMSRFDADQAGSGSNDLQHDAFFTVGLVIGG